MFKLACFLSLVALAYSATPVTQCANGATLPLQTTVNDCTQLPCELVRGSDVVMTSIFQSISDTSTLTPNVRATALGVDLDYPLPQTDGCEALLDLRCPLYEGEVATYQLVMPILAIYPEIDLNLMFTLTDEHDDIIFCFDLAARVVSE